MFFVILHQQITIQSQQLFLNRLSLSVHTLFYFLLSPLLMQPPQSYYHPPKQTVLVPSSENPISSDHPMFYVKEKNYFLEQLSNKVSINNKFNQMDIKRNVRVDHLIERHSQISKNIEKQHNRKKMFLNSNEFTPIVAMSDQEKRIKRQEKQANNLRQQLYQNYIEECEIHEAPQKDTPISKDYEQFKLVKQHEQLENFTVLSDYRSDPNRRKQLYLIDMEISKLREEENLEKLVRKKHTECQNNEFLSKVSNTILSSYMVYFDEIFAALVDELLEEEVVYFNSLEAGYFLDGQGDTSGEGNGQANFSGKRQQTQINWPKNHYKETKELEADLKAMKMLELVKALDDLAYD